MSTTQKELLELQNGSEEPNTNNPPSSQLVETEPIKNTGFQIVGNAEKGYFVALGQYRLTTFHKDKKELLKKVKDKDWEIILALIGASIEAFQQTQIPTQNGKHVTGINPTHTQNSDDTISNLTDSETQGTTRTSPERTTEGSDTKQLSTT